MRCISIDGVFYGDVKKEHFGSFFYNLIKMNVSNLFKSILIMKIQWKMKTNRLNK